MSGCGSSAITIVVGMTRPRQALAAKSSAMMTGSVPSPASTAVSSVAVAGFAALATLLTALVLAGLGTLPVIIALLFAANACLGLVMPTTMVMALDPHPEIAGLASSLGGTIQMLTGAAMIALAGPFFDGTATPMVVAIALAGPFFDGTATPR